MFRKSSKTKQNIDEDEEQPYRWVDMFQFITRSNFLKRQVAPEASLDKQSEAL